MIFLEYKLISDALYLGDRPKGNIFKPCIKTVPFTQISGALKKRFDIDEIKAVGYLTGNGQFNQTDYLIYSPKDRFSNISKVPLQVEFLTNVSSVIFIQKSESIKKIPEKFEIVMGGLRSKGFGRCVLELEGEVDANNIETGILNVRLPEEELQSFNIKRILRPIYGYLFKPTPHTFTGNYVRSLFEGSEVIGPLFLIKPFGGRNG